MLVILGGVFGVIMLVNDRVRLVAMLEIRVFAVGLVISEFATKG